MTKLLAITKRNEIRAAFELLRGKLSEGADICETKLGWKGGGTGGPVTVIWHRREDFWCSLNDNAPDVDNRYWNVFGVGDPRRDTSIVCEINPP